MMSGATKALIAYGAMCATIVYAADPDCAAMDNQSDEGSSVHLMNGTAGGAKVVFAGKYKTHATEPVAQANCRWRIFTKQRGHWVQVSPKKAGTWNHLSDLFHRGTAKLAQGQYFDSRGCPKWKAVS
jgi:hypothetical protein